MEEGNSTVDRLRQPLELPEETLYEAYLAVTEEIVLVLNREGRVLDVRAAGDETFCISPDEVLGKACDEIFSPEEAVRFRTHVGRVLDTGQRETFRYRLSISDEERWFECCSCPMSGREGEAERVISVVRDITGQERAKRQMQRLLDLQIVINRLALTLGESRDLDRMYRIVYEHVCRLTESDAFVFYSYHRPTRQLRVRYLVRAGSIQETDDLSPVPLDGRMQTVQARAIHSGNPISVAGDSGAVVLSEDLSEGPPADSKGSADPANSILLVPMQVEGETIGLLQLESTRRSGYGPEDVVTLSAVANVAAVAIQNARLYQEARRRSLEQEMLRGAALAMAKTLERDQVVERILAQLQKVVPYDTASVQLLREDTLEIVGGRGFPNLEDLLGLTFRLSREESPNREVVRRRAPFIVDDAFSTYEEFRRSPHCEAEIHSWLGVPMLVGERLIGMIALDKSEPGFYTENHARLAEVFAAQAAIAMENSRLFQSERAQRELSDALTEVAAVVNSTLELDQVLDRILDQVARVVSGDAFNVMLVEEGMARMARWRGYEALGGTVSGATFPISRYKSLMTMFQTGESVVVPDTLSARDWVSRENREWIRSYVGAPIRVEDELVGFLSVDSAEPGWFGPDDAHRLEIFASHIATAIENAQLYAEQRRRIEEASLLLQIASAINSTLDLNHILKEMTWRAAKACQVDRCTVLLLDEAEKRLVPTMSQFASGKPQPGLWYYFKAISQPLSVDKVVAARKAVKQRQLVFISDASASTLPDEWVETFGLESLMFVPITSRDEVIGVIVLDHQTEGYEFDTEQVNLALAISAQAAIAIENAKLHRELKAYAHQLEDRVEERTAQLEAQYAQLQATLESSSDGIIVANAQGEIVQTNPVADDWLKRALPPEDVMKLQDAVWMLVHRREERSSLVLELTGLDLELVGSPITEPGVGEATFVVAVHDVTHLKTLDRMKSRFVSNVSHELRTPVTTIKLYAELMQRSPPEKQAEYLQGLKEEADRQASLVEDILQISRIDAGRMELELKAHSLNQLVQGSVEGHAELAQSKGMDLIFSPADADTTVRVDVDRMRQVISNLLENAINYTSAGGQVSISTVQCAVDERLWGQIVVADTGMGIPENELPHVFERFFRGERPQRLQMPGTGLGLAIVQEIVALHGGRVTVDSELGEGSTFTAWLPAAL